MSNLFTNIHEKIKVTGLIKTLPDNDGQYFKFYNYKTTIATIIVNLYLTLVEHFRLKI